MFNLTMLNSLFNGDIMEHFFDLLKERMSQIYYVIVFSVLTLYVNDGYFDMIEAKGVMLLWTTLFYVVVIMISCMMTLTVNNKKNKYLWKKLSRMDYCLLAFAGLSLLSALISDNQKSALWGSDGCSIGAFSICLLCLACVFLCRNMRVNEYMLVIMLLSGIVVFVGGITDCFDLDIMGWHENIAASHYDYLSTIGNRDYYDGFLALVLPFVAVLFMFEKRIWLSVLYGLYLFLGFINLYIVKNDGNLLIFGSGIFLVYYILKEDVLNNRVLYLIGIFIVSSFAVNVICYFVDPVNVMGHSIMGVLQEHHWYIGLGALTLLVLWFTKKYKIPFSLEKAWVSFSIFVILILFVIVVVNFDLSFASNRGFIWSYAVNTFSRATFVKKLVGWGPDCFKSAIYSMSGADIVATWPENNQIANAHNEILQYLITMGIMGVIAYMLIYVLSLSSRLKKGNVLGMAAKTAIFTYFCTALGNNPEALNYGILFIMFAVVQGAN